MVKTGEPAPDFELASQTGETVRLSDYRGSKNVVLFFYPADDTPGCTREACAFRDYYEIFVEHGAEVIGISSDDASSHSRFAAKYNLPFQLAADTGGHVRKAYGISKTLGLLPGRVTFLVDKQGVVRHVFSSQFSPVQHVREASEALQKLG